MNKDLRICLSIFGNNHFFNEQQIIDSLTKIQDMVESRSIRLVVTDGIVSIKYKDEELLGEEYWDDVHLIMRGIFYHLEDLVDGEEVKVVLPMQSVHIMLKLNDEMITYKLQPVGKRKERGETDFVRQIPKKLFIREFVYFYLRSVRIFTTIGANARTFDEFTVGDDIEDVLMGHSFKHIFQDWQKYIPPHTFSSEEMKEIQTLMDMPLQQWVAQASC